MISTEIIAGALDVTCKRMGIVMEPDGSAAEVEGVLNPAVTRDRSGRLLLFPRAVAAGNVSRIGVARYDGSGAFERLGFALDISADYEQRRGPGGYGCEDARVTFIGALDTYVMTYTAYGPAGARVAIAVSPDAYVWTRLGLVRFHDDRLNVVDNKDAAFFPELVTSPAGVPSFAFFHRPMRPETINGQTPIDVILSLPLEQRESICIAYIPVAFVDRDIRNLCSPAESVRVLDVGQTWGRLKNGAGTPPLKTNLGWVSVFHGVDVIDGPLRPVLSYGAGIVINDLYSPHRILYRSPEPILIPETVAERFGTVDNVVFPTGIDEVGENSFDIYYGAADAKIGRARVSFAARAGY